MDERVQELRAVQGLTVARREMNFGRANAAGRPHAARGDFIILRVSDDQKQYAIACEICCTNGSGEVGSLEALSVAEAAQKKRWSERVAASRQKFAREVA